MQEPLFRMLYMRKEYSAFHSMASEFQGMIFVPEIVTTTDTDVWSGAIFIRSKRSPWAKGAFSFKVHFPPEYPTSPPVCVFDAEFRGHPLLEGDGRTVTQFAAEYRRFSPFHVSVMIRLLKFVRRLFIPTDTLFQGLPPLDEERVAQDVKRCSITASGDNLSQLAISKLLSTSAVLQWLLMNTIDPCEEGFEDLEPSIRSTVEKLDNQVDATQRSLSMGSRGGCRFGSWLLRDISKNLL